MLLRRTEYLNSKKRRYNCTAFFGLFNLNDFLMLVKYFQIFLFHESISGDTEEQQQERR